MAEKKFALNLVIRAIDAATGPMRDITKKMNEMTSPMGDKLKAFKTDFGKMFDASGLGKLGSGFSKVGEAAGKVGAEIGNLIKMIAGLALAGGAAFAAIVKSSVDAGDKLGEMAQRLGIGVDMYASLQFAAEQADVSQEDFNNSMDKFSQNLGEMTAGKGGAFLAFLNEISPGLAKQVKGAKGMEAALALVTDAIARTDDAQKRALFTKEAFGKGGKALGEFFGQGSQKIQEAQLAYERLHGPAAKWVELSGVMDNAMREGTTAFLGLRDAAVTELLPGLIELSKSVTEFLVKNREGITKWAREAGAAIKAWVDGGGFERLVSNLKSVGNGIMAVVNFLGPITTAFIAAGVVLAPLIMSIGSLAVSIAALIPVFMTFWPLIAGVVTAVSAAVLPFVAFAAAATGVALLGKTIYDNWGELTFLFKDWGNSLKNVVRDAWDFVRPIIDQMLPTLKILANPFGAAFDAGKQFFSNTMTSEGAPTAAQAAPSASRSEAKVSVDFANVPRGARVSLDPSSTQSVDLSVGPTMVSQ